jgi:hypothetical protein
MRLIRQRTSASCPSRRIFIFITPPHHETLHLPVLCMDNDLRAVKEHSTGDQVACGAMSAYSRSSVSPDSILMYQVSAWLRTAILIRSAISLYLPFSCRFYLAASQYSWTNQNFLNEVLAQMGIAASIFMEPYRGSIRVSPSLCRCTSSPETLPHSLLFPITCLKP